MTESTEVKEEEETIVTDETTSTEEVSTEAKAEAEATTTAESETTTEAAETTESTDKVEEQPTTTAEETVETAPERVVPEVDAYALPEGVPKQVAQFASENDMTQDQLDKTLTYFGQYLHASNEAQQTQLKEQGEAYVETWGDQKDYNLALVRRALNQNDPDGVLKEMLNTSGYGNHPAVLDFFLRIGNSMKEGGFLKGSVHRPTGKKTAAQTLFGDAHPSVN